MPMRVVCVCLAVASVAGAAPGADCFAGPQGAARVRLLGALNAERVAHGARALRLSDPLCTDAQARAEAMEHAGRFLPSRSPQSLERVKRLGYDAHFLSELLIQTPTAPEDLVRSWRQEGAEAYREALRPELRDLGVGIAELDDMSLYVLELGVPWPEVFAEKTAGLQDLNSVRREMLLRVNDERAKSNAPPVRQEPRLNRAAQDYAELMLTRSHYGHTGPDGGTVMERTEETGYEPQLVEENIAKGQFTVVEVMGSWLASPPHRHNLLSREVSEAGFGVAAGQNANGCEVLWVQVFARPRRN